MDSINFDVKDGIFVSLIGKNGSGKSTLLKCLMNILKPKTGVILIDKNNISNLHELDLAKLRASVLSDRVYPFNMTVKELISLGRYPHQKLLEKSQFDDEVIYDAALLLGVENLLEKKFSELSDGQKQKVLIARAVCQKPKVLILDEPATHLDAPSRVEILLKLKEISRKENIIVIASMHEIEITFRISDQILILDEGKIIANGTPEQILSYGFVDKILKNNKMIWSPRFGSLEIRVGYEIPNVHVVCGGGTGIPIFRLLARLDYSFSVGVLDKIDADYHFAKEIRAPTISNIDEYEPLEKFLPEAISKLSKIKIFIDSGFSLNRQSKTNVELIKNLCDDGKAILLSLRDSEEGKQIFGVLDDVCYVSINNLEQLLAERLQKSSRHLKEVLN